MKIEKLTENKLKITLSIDDLEERNINLHSFMYNTPESQDLFWELLKTAEKECGFNVDDSMIYVEASTSGSGNFTLLVTKTNEAAPTVETKQKKLTKEKFKLKRKTVPLKSENTVYIFDSFDDICAFCNICDTTILHKNTLYSMNEIYYLKIDYIPYNMVLDYATIAKNPALLEAKLNEYGKIVIENDALQTISKHFNKKKTIKRTNKTSGK